MLLSGKKWLNYMASTSGSHSVCFIKAGPNEHCCIYAVPDSTVDGGVQP
jgi:hypothetical protein